MRPENGIEDYNDDWVLVRIIKHYSNFTSYSIISRDIREEVAKDETGSPRPDGPETFRLKIKYSTQ